MIFCRLKQYLVFAQDEAKARAWAHGAEEFSPEPMVIEGQDAVIEVVSLGIDLPLAEIYVGAEHR